MPRLMLLSVLTEMKSKNAVVLVLNSTSHCTDSMTAELWTFTVVLHFCDSYVMCILCPKLKTYGDYLFHLEDKLYVVDHGDFQIWPW